MADELVITCEIDSPDKKTPMLRSEFYSEQIKEFRKNSKPSRAVSIIELFLFNEHGELFIQKRSDTKAHNPGLLDNSVGGHIKWGDGVEFTMMVESVQELQAPAIALRTDEDFIKTFKLLQEYLSTISLQKKVDSRIFLLEKIFHGEKVIIANKKYVFFGVFHGAVKTVDREAKGILLYSLDDLIEEMKSRPEIFTHDLKEMIATYEDKLRAFVKEIAN